MRRSLLVVIATAALAVTGWLALGFFGDKLRRLLMLTTADPEIIGGVAPTSILTPVDVTLGSTWETAPKRDAVGRAIGEHVVQRDRTIVFRLPAAYVSGIGKARKDKYPWRVEFTVWSDTFEPFGPDRLGPRVTVEEKMRQRNAGPREIELTAVYTIEADERQRMLRYHGLRDTDPKPCDRTYDPEIAMTRVTVPSGIKDGDSCLFAKGENGVNYVKRHDDGSIKFIVTCDASGLDRARQPNRPSRCQLRGYFRGRPLFVWVKHSEIRIFDTIYERVTAFLSAHAVGEL